MSNPMEMLGKTVKMLVSFSAINYNNILGVFHDLLEKIEGGDRETWLTELKRFLRKEPCWVKEKRWTEEDGVISFTLPPTDGTTGKQWIARTDKKGNRVGDYARQLLLSADFKPTTGVVYTVNVLKGELFSDSDRITKNIRAEAKKRKFQTPNAELACLIRKNFSDEELKEMGLYWIVVMHEPIKDSDGNLELLGVSRDTAGGDGQWLGFGYGASSDNRWDRTDGFAFLAPQD